MGVIKILLIANILILPIFYHCKFNKGQTDASHKYEDAVFPDKMFGIDFCKLQFIDIVRVLYNKRVAFQCYDGDGIAIKCTASKEGLNKICRIDTDYFIGRELDKDKIIDIAYFHMPYDDYFIFKIEFKEEYYDIIYDLLKNKLGSNTARVNEIGYDEISWRADPQMSVPTCISKIILSKRYRYETIEEAKKGVCYLSIQTRARNPHIH
jgi:hypothetical protein